MSWTLKRKARLLLETEQGAIRKDRGGRLAVALVYPNTYAVGMSNLGFQTIYAHLNAIPDVVCERVFFPDPEDMDEQQRTRVAPFSLESLRPLGEFDLIGFSVAYEGDYLNVVRVLRMAGGAARPPAAGPRRRPRPPPDPEGGGVRVLQPRADGAVHGPGRGGGGRGDGERAD